MVGAIRDDIMKPDPDRLIGVNEIGLPDPDNERLSWGTLPTCTKKTAALAEPQRGGRKGLREATAKPLRRECRKALRLTSIVLVACFSDEGRFFGWEVAR